MTSRESYEKFCASVGVKPMPETEWNVYNNSIRSSEVSGYYAAAAKAAVAINSKPHDDRAINPIPEPQAQHISCRPTRTIRKRDFHGRNRRRLWQLLQMDKATAGTTAP